MEIRPHRIIHRKKTKKIMVGKVPVGGDSIISIQSMTNTITSDASKTIKQIIDLEKSGADIVRVSCPDEASTLALKEIVKEVNVPIVADIHFHHKRAIEAAKMGASCLRINPGNIGASNRLVLSPTPPVECLSHTKSLSTIPCHSKVSPEFFIAWVIQTVSSAVIPF